MLSENHSSAHVRPDASRFQQRDPGAKFAILGVAVIALLLSAVYEYLFRNKWFLYLLGAITFLEIIEAGDGQEALHKITEAVPDLILLDIQMPVLDGFGTLKQLREDPRLASVRVLALTAYAMRGDREKVMAAGFDGYISKPIDPAGLRAQLKKLLKE